MSNLYLLKNITYGYSTEFLFFLTITPILLGIFIIITKNPIISVLYLILLFSSIKKYNIWILNRIFIFLNNNSYITRYIHNYHQKSYNICFVFNITIFIYIMLFNINRYILFISLCWSSFNIIFVYSYVN